MGFYGGQKEVNPREMDPLYSGSGAAKLREGIFNQLPGLVAGGQQAAGQAVNAARSGAASMLPVQAYGQKVLRGGMLDGSPQLDRALSSARVASDQGAAMGREEARGQLSTQQAGTREQFARSGQTFGTGGQLAQEGAAAGLEHQLNRGEVARQSQLAATEDAQRAGNYMQERGYQQAAPGILQNAASARTQMLQAVPGMQYAGIEPAVAAIRNLAGGGQTVNPNTYYKPGVGDYAMQGIGAAAGGGAMGM